MSCKTNEAFEKQQISETLDNTQSNVRVSSEPDEQQKKAVQNGEQVEVDDIDVLDQLQSAQVGETEKDMQYLQVTATVEKMTDMNEYKVKQNWGDANLRQLPKYTPAHYLKMNENAFAGKRETGDEHHKLTHQSSQISITSNTPYKVPGHDNGITYDQSYMGSQVGGERSECDLNFSQDEVDNFSQSDLFCFDRGTQ